MSRINYAAKLQKDQENFNSLSVIMVRGEDRAGKENWVEMEGGGWGGSVPNVTDTNYRNSSI